ncbi:MAG TPA: peptidase [Stenotrophomonas sp.]|nr:peptidase [Stenotrophomonas sp.]
MRRKQNGVMVWTTLAAMLLALPAAATPVPSLPAREQMLGLLEHRALYRDRVDWAALRRDLAANDDPDRQRRLLSDAINRATAGHGGWMSAEELHDVYRKKGDGSSVAPVAVSPAGPEETYRIDARLGLISVGPYLPDPGLPREQQRAAERQEAQRLQDHLWRQDDGSRCGWIVDLGDNTGGDMWPMLLGVGPLLRGRADGPDVVGHFFDGAALQPWRYREGAVWVGDAPRLESDDTARRLRRPDAPVAVLQSGRTASSGEAIVLAFRGRPHSRSFGTPTMGYSTGNVPVTLVDGSTLLLTGTVMKDRNGIGDGSRIVPDVPAAQRADAMRLAQAWLLAQPACGGKPAGNAGPDARPSWKTAP